MKGICKKKMVKLSEKKKTEIYKKLLVIANHYYFFLSNQKRFLIIDETFSAIEVSFTMDRFIHLTGVKVNFGEKSFFKYFLKGKFRKENISEKQKYSYRTIMQKLNNIDIIYPLLSSNGNETLILGEISTNSRIYPYGLYGNTCAVCLDFPNNYKAVSIRNSSQTNNFKSVTTVIAVLVKDIDEEYFNKFLYIKNKYTENSFDNEFRKNNNIICLDD